MVYGIGVDFRDARNIAFAALSDCNIRHIGSFHPLPEASLHHGRSKEKGGRRPPDPLLILRVLLFAVAHELQQEDEQVDEVEIELQRAHDRLAAGIGQSSPSKYISLSVCVS